MKIESVFLKIFFINFLFIIGCAKQVELHPASAVDLWQTRQDNILNNQELSIYSQKIIQANFLQELLNDNKIACIEKLHREACQFQNRNIVFTLAEICYQYAADNKDKEFYLRATKYAYHYLFNQSLQPQPSPQDPRYRLTCDIYNLSFSGSFGNNQQPINFDTISSDTKYYGFSHRKEDFQEFLIADNFDVEGMDSMYRLHGIGVPLIAVRKPIKSPAGIEKYYLENEQGFPATIIAKISGSLQDLEKNKISLHIYNPINVQSIEINKKQISLEANFTTPFVYILTKLDKNSRFNPFKGLFSAEDEQKKTGILMLSPYQEDKIPVILTHGLASRPLTWLQMLNNLNNNPQLRQHYQFWVFGYPTGNPILYSAHLMRNEINKVYQLLDPEQKNPFLKQTVLIGHSMGGVLSRIMVQNSEDKLLKVFTRKIPLEKIPFTTEERKMVDQIFTFNSLPFVTRTIFIAAPHRGSEISDYSIVEMLTGFIKLPQTIAEAQLKFVNAVMEQFQDMEDSNDPLLNSMTSIKGLSPNNYYMQTMAKQPITVKFHSIIGDINNDEIENGSDGVVPYSSSHLDGAESEKIVPEGHSCTGHPLTIKEVCRILKEHIAQVQQPK